MGFGHRVYKNYDPRAKIIREVCYQVLEKLADSNNPLFELGDAPGRDRIRTSTSSERSCTRTSISIPASSIAPWASRQHVHRDVRDRPHRRLGQSLDGDARRSPNIASGVRASSTRAPGRATTYQSHALIRSCPAHPQSGRRGRRHPASPSTTGESDRAVDRCARVGRRTIQPWYRRRRTAMPAASPVVTRIVQFDR